MRGDFQGVVEMLCIAGKEETAISIAKETQQFSTLADVGLQRDLWS